MWRLRLALIDLKPEVDPEQDRQKFTRLTRDAELVVRFFSAPRQLQGLFLLWTLDGIHEGTKYRYLALEYGYIAPAWRGHPTVLLTYLFTFTSHLDWRHPRTRHFTGGIGYPVGVIALTQSGGDLLLYGAKDLDPLEREVLEHVMRFFAPEGFDPHTGAVWLPTLPRPLTERFIARTRHSPQLAAYLEANPHWASGFGWPAVCSISPAQMARAILARIASLFKGS